MNQIHNTNPLEVAHFHRIDINLYPLFIAIFEQKSISKAAQLLCISQSAVSHALQRLRVQLKDDYLCVAGKKCCQRLMLSRFISRFKWLY
jgi:hypothetical protein